MNKHTPGKWTHDSQEALHIRAEDGGLVATLGWSNGRHFSKGRREYEEVRANARLIAASPELLEALCMLVRCTVTVPGTHGLAIDNALAVIAKATGEQS